MTPAPPHTGLTSCAPPPRHASRAPAAAHTPRELEPVEVERLPRRVDLRLLVPVLVAWPVVAFVGLFVPVSWVWFGALASCVGALVVMRARPRSSRRRHRASSGLSKSSRIPASSSRARLLALTLAVLSLTLLAAAGHRAVRDVGPLGDLAAERAVATLRGVVDAEPLRLSAPSGPDGGQEAGRAQKVLVRLAVTEVEARGQVVEVDAPVLLLGDIAWAERRWQEHVTVVVRLDAPEPGDDVVAIARPKGKPLLTGDPGLLFRVAEAVRMDFRAATAGLTPDARGLVPALVIGDTSRTPPDLTQAMLDTGMSHLSAVSGSNVTLVLAAAMLLCQGIGVPRRGRPWVALGVLVAFVVLARPEPSVIRAAVMGTVGLLALSTSRRQAGVPALAGAVVALLVWDPWLARSYGFALSSVATLGLLLFAQPWGRVIARGLPRRLRWFGPVLAVPLAAQAVCAPIVVPLQGSVSIVAVPANLLAAPLVAPTTIVGVGVAVLSVGWTGGASWLAWLAGIPAQGIAWVARSCAEMPFGSVPWGHSAGAAVALAVVTAGVVVLAPWAWQRARVRPLLAGAVVVLVSVLTMPTTPLSWPPPAWVLVACDVGQGDGLVLNNGVRDGIGHAVVIDTGSDPEVIDRCLERLGIGVVDLVILSHFHADHVAGLEGVLDDRHVGEIRVSPVKDPEFFAREVDELATATGVPVRELRAGDEVILGSVVAEVWWPARMISAGSVPNNGSVVLTVRARGLGILLSGDVEREAAAEVVRAARREPERWGHIDVYKVAHHGSSNRDDAILDLVDGRIALISVGEDNDYGHPAPSLLQSLARRGFEVHRTDLEGDLAVAVDREGRPVVRTH